ncbi:MAG: SDR family NAD(P)-dependent oxidoreductase [Spongiibacter marinus]|uniref:SDR family NAD(P)-dependent oxidoreductase n=1 Tax=Spongiibacter marinus TaxID=354246 RepID=UPI003C68923D
MSIHCKDKVVLITGAAKGIGAAACHALAAAGAKLAVSDIDQDAGRALCEALRAAGADAGRAAAGRRPQTRTAAAT